MKTLEIIFQLKRLLVEIRLTLPNGNRSVALWVFEMRYLILHTENINGWYHLLQASHVLTYQSSFHFVFLHTVCTHTCWNVWLSTSNSFVHLLQSTFHPFGNSSLLNGIGQHNCSISTQRDNQFVWVLRLENTFIANRVCPKGTETILKQAYRN